VAVPTLALIGLDFGPHLTTIVCRAEVDEGEKDEW
jgi:hypothetical protein